MHNKVTIFTPAYNRAHLLYRLYKTLLEQEDQNFEWILVDDGSSDNTREVVSKFIDDRKIPITYIYQKNQGKHIAINTGVNIASGTLFLIVDSDDYITSDAVRLIRERWNEVEHSGNHLFGGVVFNKSYTSNEMVGSPLNYETLDVSYVDYRFKYKIIGDKAEVFLTNVLKEFPFPQFAGERFCPEALIWNRISTKYILRYCNASIYFCEYLEGGLTDNIVLIRMKSPVATSTYYAELAGNRSIDIKEKAKAIINYWRFAHYLPLSFREKQKKLNIRGAFMFYPLSLLFIIKDRSKLKN